MPEADYPSRLINIANGSIHPIRSWILGRIVRDFHYWKPQAVDDELQPLLENPRWATARVGPDDNSRPVPPRLKRVGLCVSIFHFSPHLPFGTPIKDWVFYSGIVTAIIQLGIASLPYALYHDWSVLAITACGTLLAFVSGTSPLWKHEKWTCRKRSKTVVLTSTSLAQHAIVIIGRGSDPDLQELAIFEPERTASTLHRSFGAFLAVLWLVLLVSVAGLKQNTWFMLAVGGLGMVQNVVVGGASRKPKSFGLHLELDEVIAGPKVMRVLMDVEGKYPGVGTSMVDTFFPGGNLMPNEEIFWQEVKKGSGR